MTIQQDLVVALAGVAGGRVYPQIAPDNPTAPFVVYSRVAGTPSNTLNDGRSIINSRFQIDCYERTYSGVQSLRSAVMGALDAWALRPVLLTETDVFDDDVKLHRALIEISVWHST